MHSGTLQKTIESLDKLRERILSRLSHELRTPVTSIVGYAEALLTEPSMRSETRQEFIEIIKEESDRLSSLVDGLLELFALERGTVALNRAEADVIPVVDLAIKSLSSDAEKKSLTVTPFYDQTSVWAIFDRDRLFEALLHIIDNAIKFSPQGGQVIVGVRADASSVEIMIGDNGKGIPVRDSELVLRGLYRVQRDGEEIRGAGTGLAIAKHLIELHDGQISLVSKENEGSVFTLRIPVRRNSMTMSV
ncbi:MAG: HAMP domain-containing histidine kinase [Ignavibacteriales bacterium]|nr:HAMP domain-containing histidine kinase [Ignavibacteriales bacterium]